jgi:hypothetical protein
VLVRGYFIRHLKRGVLTDRVYLSPPSEETLRAVCGATDVTAGLVRTAETTVDFYGADLSRLEPPPLPEPETPSNPDYFEVIVAGSGSVKNPE